MHDETLIGEFTHQAADFNAMPVFSAEETLGALLELADPRPDERWLETACGTAHISRALAPRVASVQGIDLTPAMLDQARETAAAEKLDNVSFALGDATALDLPDGEFDAAVTRFSLHHIPLPGRVFTELARVVRPGGKVVVADHVTDEDVDAAIWHTEVERLRDPSHWTNLTPRQLRARGEAAGLRAGGRTDHPVRARLRWLGRAQLRGPRRSAAARARPGAAARVGSELRCALEGRPP